MFNGNPTFGIPVVGSDPDVGTVGHEPTFPSSHVRFMLLWPLQIVNNWKA